MFIHQKVKASPLPNTLRVLGKTGQDSPNYGKGGKPVFLYDSTSKTIVKDYSVSSWKILKCGI